MKETSVSDRLTYLAETFDVFDVSDKKSIEAVLEKLVSEGYTTQIIRGTIIQGGTNGSGDGQILAIISSKVNEKRLYSNKKISIGSDVFSAMIAADPSDNKMYLQWMLTLFTRLLKDENPNTKTTSIHSAIRLVEEDLPQANIYLELFEGNKRKKKFRDLCKSSHSVKHVEDPTNINQYKSLAQLFDAVDPFIEKEPSALERTMQKFVELGQAEIPVKDRKFTVYVPKTTEASVIFSSFAGWCTAVKGNGMFDRYTTENKKPNGKKSDIYIIINNKFFGNDKERDTTDDLYQIHFESRQIKNKSNGQNVSIFETVLNESEGVLNYFKEELMGMAKTYKKGIDSNMYIDYLIQFGFAESLFDMLDTETESIKFMSKEIPKLPDMSRFKMVNQFIITDAKMVELHPSIGKLEKLELLALTDNNIKSLPKEIGSLKKLEFINLTGNPLCEVPDELAYLDKSRGGNLVRFGVKRDKIGDDVYNRLKKLLPTTPIG